MWDRRCKAGEVSLLAHFHYPPASPPILLGDALDRVHLGVAAELRQNIAGHEIVDGHSTGELAR